MGAADRVAAVDELRERFLRSAVAMISAADVERQDVTRMLDVCGAVASMCSPTPMPASAQRMLKTMSAAVYNPLPPTTGTKAERYALGLAYVRDAITRYRGATRAADQRVVAERLVSALWARVDPRFDRIPRFDPRVVVLLGRYDPTPRGKREALGDVGILAHLCVMAGGLDTPKNTVALFERAICNAIARGKSTNLYTHE